MLGTGETTHYRLYVHATYTPEASASLDTDQPFGELITTTIRVATWNLWWRFGPWERRAPLVEATLAAIGADVICLQEVWDDGTTNQAAVLAARLGMSHIYASRRSVEGVAVGNAVLARSPIASHDWRPLPAGRAPDEGRLVLRADVAGPRGLVQVFCTHLNWRFDHSAIRQLQVRAIGRFVDESRPTAGRVFPALLAGDLNAVPESDEVRMLTGKADLGEGDGSGGVVFHDAWEVAGEGRGTTWSNENSFARGNLEPDRRIDYVLAGWPKAGGAGHVVACRVHSLERHDGIEPSDHAPVVADLRY
jgi:endonuclease/exonuclease/phosphatase family metal-dependent hydrolase